MARALDEAMAPPRLMREAAATLRRAGVANATQECRWLLEAAGGVPPGLALEGEALPPGAVERFDALVRRRAAHEPLQHLVGSAFFRGLEFEVTPATLIPRPETELLVEAALERLPQGPWVGADIGAGSGCVAVGLTQAHPACRMIAVDRSREALVVAARNARRHGVAARVALVQGDWCEALSGTGGLACLVSNPPYIPTDELTALPPEVQREPHPALDGGPDGLAYHRRLLAEGPRLLQPGGWLLMEMGIGQASAVVAMARRLPRWTAPETLRDQQGIARVLVTRRMSDGR